MTVRKCCEAMSGNDEGAMALRRHGMQRRMRDGAPAAQGQRDDRVALHALNALRAAP